MIKKMGKKEFDSNSSNTGMEKSEFDSNDSNMEVSDLFADLEDDGGIDSIQKLKRHKQKISLRTRIIGYLSLFLVICSIFLLGVYYFLLLSLKPKDKLGEYEKMYVDTINSILLQFTSTGTSLTGSNVDTNNILSISSYVQNPGILFYDKLKYKDDFEKEYYNKIQFSYLELKKYQNLLIQYKFFPKELQNVVKNIRILPILTTLNAIKLYVMDYVYIKAGLFKEQIFDFVYTRSKFPGTYGLISPDKLLEYVKLDIQYFKDQGAYEYLKNIYFNYMCDSTDSLTNAYFVTKFDKTFSDKLTNRYQAFKKEYPDLGKEQFIADYVRFIKNIYARTINLYNNKEGILPVDIHLLSYDPNSEQLSFSIKLMLSPEINSKIGAVQLLSEIVTLCRESRLIIGKTISYDNIKLRKITKKIGNYKLTFVSAEQKFITSVQPEVDVEVTDTSY